MHSENTPSSTKTLKNCLSRNILQIVMISGVLLLFIVASVLIILFAQSRTSPSLSSTIHTTTAKHENISSTLPSSTPSSTTKRNKNQCPSIAGVLQFTSDLDLPYSSPAVRNIQRSNIISRKEWEASEVEYERINLIRPDYVIVSHTLQESCDSTYSCSKKVRELQKFDLEQMKLDDIRYNFIIGGDGNVYEGRGWNFVGQHTDGYNNISLSIAFIGDYNKDIIGLGQKAYFYWLLKTAVEHQKIIPDYKLVGQCQVDFSTDSPGIGGYVLVSNHERWIKNP